MTVSGVSGQSVLNIGLGGMQQSRREMAEDAHTIANAGNSGPVDTTLDIAEPMINMKLEQNIFDASAEVVKTADEMVGSLLDIMA